MMAAVYAVFLVAISSISVSNVYSQSNDCGHLSGKDSEEGNFPWIVTIKHKSDLYDTCNGILIDRRHFLTSARCVVPRQNMLDDYIVRVDSKDWNKSEKYNITCVTKHPRYDPINVYDDIAIVTLSRDVDTLNFTPICLPDNNLRTKDLDGLTVAAWIPELWHPEHTLEQFRGFSIISNKDCNNILSEMDEEWSRSIPAGVGGDMFCTDNPTGPFHLCSDFAGAPIMYKDNRNKWIAIGISVWKFSLCEIGSPRMYIKISEYVEWIEENTGNGKGECR